MFVIISPFSDLYSYTNAFSASVSASFADTILTNDLIIVPE